MLQQLQTTMESRIFGQQQNIRLLITALLAGGHVLLEGVPGLGKTKMVRTLAELMDGEYRRIQFTPDMMPSDVTGNMIFNLKDNEFHTVKGPIFTNILLADEINRTPPKTQSALLEAMEEHQVTIHGNTHALPNPFLVIATQNPVEYEGTYILPEAQLDRFLFKLIIDYPSHDYEVQILKNHHHVEKGKENKVQPIITLDYMRDLRRNIEHINIEDSLVVYIATLIRKTRESKRIQLGASPRAGIAILMASKAWALLEGREFVTPDDIKMVARPALRHRIILAPQVELEGGTSDQIIQELFASIPVPR